jgi:protein associated with RNAse G/E
MERRHSDESNLMDDEEFKKVLCDYFTSAELVELLDIQIENLVEYIDEEIQENKEKLIEFITYGD